MDFKQLREIEGWSIGIVTYEDKDIKYSVPHAQSRNATPFDNEQLSIRIIDNQLKVRNNTTEQPYESIAMGQLDIPLSVIKYLFDLSEQCPLSVMTDYGMKKETLFLTT